MKWEKQWNEQKGEAIDNKGSEEKAAFDFSCKQLKREESKEYLEKK